LNPLPVGSEKVLTHNFLTGACIIKHFTAVINSVVK